MDDIVYIVGAFAASIAMIVIAVVFIYKYARYKFVGNALRFIFYAYLICLFLSFIVNLNPLDAEKVKTTYDFYQGSSSNPTVISLVNQEAPKNVSFNNGWIAVLSSFFDAAKMLTLAFDRSVIGPYFDQQGWRFAFGVVYVIASFFALLTTSLSVILFRGKSAWAKIKNFFKWFRFWDKEYYFIFSDSKSAEPTIKLGEVLKASNRIVVMYVSKASLKTQEGTEYRDALINQGFDVKSEGFNEEICSFLFNKYFGKKVTVYGIFASDSASFELANNFKSAITDNTKFGDIEERLKKHKWDADEKKTPKRIKKDYERIRRFRVFVTYHDYDMDLVSNFSGSTLHIVNTLSQYDMVSSEFLLNNPIDNFIDLSEEHPENDSLNVSFFGFGKINKPIFEKMTFAYQTSEDNVNKVHYHIYDKYSNEMVEHISNEYSAEKIQDAKGYLGKPRLYHLKAECNGKDLTSYEILKQHFEGIKDKNRFNENGFELFIVSAAKTNQDIQISFNLRDVLLKCFSKEKLQNTFIFVRISDVTVADNLVKAKANKNIVFRQKADDEHKLVPIIIFGEDTNMEHFIKKTYDDILEKGRLAYGSYYQAKEEVWHSWREKVEWLFSNKKELLSNTATVYSLSAKLNILGYKINKEGKIVCKDGTTPTETIIKKPSYPPSEKDRSKSIYRVAALEHNRWLATNYYLCKHGQAKISDYCKNNTALYEEEKERWELDSKLDQKTKHICMTTNKGLIKLYEESLKGIKGNSEEIKKQVLKLVFDNDIDTMIRIFDSMKAVTEIAEG